MTNVLVVEDNFYQSKQIINYLSQRNKELKLYSMVYSGEEALEIIEEQKVDIIILDLKLKGMNGVDVIKEIEYKKIEKYRSSIIVVSGDYSMIRQVYNSDYIYRCFLKPFNFNEIEESIEKIICENNYEMETDVKSKINKELKKLKFNFTYKGTKYLSECIYQIYKSNESDVDNLSKEFYPIVAEKYNKSVNTIYGNIKQAINAMFFDCEERILKEYFKYSFVVKPKSKEIVYIILNKLYG